MLVGHCWQHCQAIPMSPGPVEHLHPGVTTAAVSTHMHTAPQPVLDLCTVLVLTPEV